MSAPREPSLLNLTAMWARASALGDLRASSVRSEFLELRVWRGFGASETNAIVVRRAEGRWSAFLARVIRCEIQIPRTVGDTASAATMRQFVAEARRHCGQSVTDVSAGAQLIATDTVVVERLAVSDADVEAAWTEARAAGVLQLPGRVTHSSTSSDGITYVIEIRRGDEYRASEIAHVDPPEVEADSVVRRVYAAVERLRR